LRRSLLKQTVRRNGTKCCCRLQLQQLQIDAEEHPRDIHVYTIVAVTIMERVRSHTNKSTCASRSHTLH
jgi:hypothetical protein